MDVYQTLLKMDDTLRHGGQHPKRRDLSKAHIRNCFFVFFLVLFVLFLLLLSCSSDLESACRCRLCGPNATMSAPPLGTSQVWKAEWRRGGLIFHASLHEEKLCEARRGESASPTTVYTKLILLFSWW